MRAMQIIEWGRPLEARDYPDPEPQGEEGRPRAEAAGGCHGAAPLWGGASTGSGLKGYGAVKKRGDGVGADDHLVIIGAGGVGGSAVHIAPAAVGSKVIVADIDAQKRAHARQMGAVATIDNAAPDAVKQVMAATCGGAAAAIAFVCSPQTIEVRVYVLTQGW